MMYWRTWRRYTALRVALWRLLKKKIEDLTEPEARVMLDVAERDYLNSVKFEKGLIGYSDSLEVANMLVEEELEKTPATAIRKINDWLDLWLVKWRQRVRLALSPTREELEAKKMENEVIFFFNNLPFIEELRDIVIGSLINNGEICFVEFLADSIIKNSLIKMYRHVMDKKRLIEILRKNPYVLLNDALKQVKALKGYKGPLVSIRVEKVLEESVAPYRRFYF